MTIRITGGVARGRLLREPISSGVRPTSSRVREALFSLVGQDLTGVTVLDAFGGAGLVGLEAWSRGADVTVIERDGRALRALERRGQELDAVWRVVHGDVMRMAPRLTPFDGVFADPPYKADSAAVVLALAPCARQWLVVETDREARCPDTAAALALDRTRDYGGTRLWVYRQAERQDLA